MQRYEQMEERMEIVLSSRQIMVLAVLIVGMAMVMFVVGFSMGKRSERRRVVLGTPQAAADLLTRLDEMEKESREFVAKKALTQIRKRELPVEELPAADTSATPEPSDGSASASGKTAAPNGPASRPQAARAKAQGTIALNKAQGTIALNKAQSTIALNKARPVTSAAGKTAGMAAGKTAGSAAGKTAGSAAGKTAGSAAGKTAGTAAGRTLSGSFGPAPRRVDAAPARKSDGRRATAQN